MKLTLKSYTENPERAIADAARISHMAERSEAVDDARLIENLIEWGHMSPIEFASATFYLEGVSRSCLAQLTRHRLASFMVRSMRYVRQEEGERVVPPTISNRERALEKYQAQINEAFQLYDELVEMGIPKEDARFVLPIGSSTDLYIKANFREYRHIVNLRDTQEAQWEIREIAHGMLERLWQIAPSVFQDLKDERESE